jgi:hypothetical protein
VPVFSSNLPILQAIVGLISGFWAVTENARLMTGIRYLHISDAGIEGGGGGFDGL